MKVGIIGHGRLGSFLAHKLKEDFHIFIYEQKKIKSEFTQLSLKEIAKLDIIIPCVPISKFENLIKKIAPHLNPNCLIIDVCSVKVHPVKIMKSYLPKTVEILATHPMFGPDSAKETLYGSKIVLHPVRICKKKYQEILNYLKRNGLTLLEKTPVQHDKEISQSLLITHFIGRSLIDMKADHLSIDTKGYKRLMKILETVENDSSQLFKDMFKYNSYAKQTLNKFLQSVQKVQKGLS